SPHSERLSYTTHFRSLARRLRFRLRINAHGPRELLPRRTVHKCIGVPGAQVTFVRRHSRARSFHGCFWSEMCNHDIIPGVAVLMAKNNKMIGHWVLGIGR